MLQDLNVDAPGWRVQCFGCGMWHRESIWLNGIPYGRQCLGKWLLQTRGPEWLTQKSMKSETAELRRLARAATPRRQILASIREYEEEAAEIEAERYALQRAQRRQEASAHAAAAWEPKRRRMSRIAVVAIGTLTTLLACATLFFAVFVAVHPSRFVEFVHWRTVHYGVASGALILALGAFLRLTKRSGRNLS